MHAAAIVERSPREARGSEWENVSQSRRLAIEATISSGPPTGQHESLRLSAACAVTIAPRTTLTSCSWSPFMIAKDLVPVAVPDAS
jgi:hypothetical protein